MALKEEHESLWQSGVKLEELSVDIMRTASKFPPPFPLLLLLELVKGLITFNRAEF